MKVLRFSFLTLIVRLKRRLWRFLFINLNLEGDSMVRIYSPYLEVLWKRLPGSLKDIKEAGFDGVECHLIGRLLGAERIKELRKEASRLGLEIRFHQGWSWETGQRNLFNKILRPLNQLVPTGMSLAEQMRNVWDHPVVVYGNQVGLGSPPNYLYQTSSQYVGGMTHAMDFDEFVREVKRTEAPVVFDTQHVLEWSLNVHNVTGLPISHRRLVQLTQRLWDELHPYVKEIHLCDFDPRLGASKGRNVQLGTGVFPLDAFGEMVKESKWSGVVTPEVNPSYLEGGVPGLRQLRDRVDALIP